MRRKKKCDKEMGRSFLICCRCEVKNVIKYEEKKTNISDKRFYFYFLFFFL